MIEIDSLRNAVALTPKSRTYKEQLAALSSIIGFLKPTRYLEVGAFEGRSALLFSALAACFVQNKPVHVTSIDSWMGGDEHQASGIDMSLIEQRFDGVIRECKSWHPSYSNFEKIKALSVDGLVQIRDRAQYYDLIMIDAGHKAKDVLSDLVHCWPLLRPGGIVILDDYTWMPKHQTSGMLLHSPKMGIDAFCSCYAEDLTILSNMPLLQLYVLKQSPADCHYVALTLESFPVPPELKSAILGA